MTKKIIITLIIIVAVAAGIYVFNSTELFNTKTNVDNVNKEVEEVDSVDIAPEVSESESNNDWVKVDEQFSFNSKTKEWKDDQGICHTCTVENGFTEDGKIIVE